MSKTSEFIETIPEFHYAEPAVEVNEAEFEKVIRSRSLNARQSAHLGANCPGGSLNQRHFGITSFGMEFALKKTLISEHNCPPFGGQT